MPKSSTNLWELPVERSCLPRWGMILSQPEKRSRFPNAYLAVAVVVMLLFFLSTSSATAGKNCSIRLVTPIEQT